MCAQHDCRCISPLNRKLSHDEQLKMALVHTLNCTSERSCECAYASMKPSKASEESASSSNYINSSIEANNVFDKTVHSNDKKSLYMSKACKYSFIASDYTSPEGQKLLSIKVYQKPPDADTYVSKSKNFSSKRSISEYFLSRNATERELPDERSKDNLLKSWQRTFFKPVTLIPPPLENPSNCDINLTSLHDSEKETALSSPVTNDLPIPSSRKSSYSLQTQAHNLNVFDSEPGISGTVNEFADDRNFDCGSSDEKHSHKNYNLNPNVNFKVFDIESLSESGEPCDNNSLENNAHFGLDDAWFIPSARHTFNGADISGSASAAQLSIASSFGDSSLPTCKICHTAAKPDDPLISPCRCTGTLRYIHCGCLMVSFFHYIYVVLYYCSYSLYFVLKQKCLSKLLE